LTSFEFQLANVQDSRHNLADSGNILFGELKPSKGSLELLKAPSVVDANSQLGWMAEISPPLLTRHGSARSCGIGCMTHDIETQVFLLRGTRAGKQVV
jgi:hypothetical protein